VGDVPMGPGRPGPNRDCFSLVLLAALSFATGAGSGVLVARTGAGFWVALAVACLSGAIVGGTYRLGDMTRLPKGRARHG
jgi:hypothetical protein